MSRGEFLKRGIIGVVASLALFVAGCRGGDGGGGNQENGEENGEEEDEGGGS